MGVESFKFGNEKLKQVVHNNSVHSGQLRSSDLSAGNLNLNLSAMLTKENHNCCDSYNTCDWNATRELAHTGRTTYRSKVLKFLVATYNHDYIQKICS